MKKFFIFDNTNSKIWIAVPFARLQNVLKDFEINSTLDEIHKFFQKSVVTHDSKYAVAVIKKRLILLVRIGMITDEESRLPITSMLEAGFEEKKLANGTSFRTGLVLEDFGSYVYGVIVEE